MPKLNQVLAVERQIKTNSTDQATKLYQLLEKPALTRGQTRTYAPIADEGEQLPDENTSVQVRVEEVLAEIAKHWVPLYDVSLQRDKGNCEAKADIVVNGEVLLKDVPATYLLWLEKKLTDFHTIVVKLPTLPAEGTWTFDAGQNCYRDEMSKRARTKKVPVPITLAEATKEHPAQVQLGQEDVLVGYWSQTAYSGAVPRKRAQELRDRVEDLMAAVKKARESANLVEAPEQNVGRVIFDFLLKND
jgi:hypothetical protein